MAVKSVAPIGSLFLALMSVHGVVQWFILRSVLFLFLGLAPFALFGAKSTALTVTAIAWAAVYGIFVIVLTTPFYTGILLDAVRYWRGVALRFVPALESIAKDEERQRKIKEMPKLLRWVLELFFWMNPLSMTALIALTYIRSDRQEQDCEDPGSKIVFADVQVTVYRGVRRGEERIEHAVLAH